MDFTKQAVSMKKMTMAVIMVLLLVLISWAEIREERKYVNLSFTVWQLDNGASEAARRINTPIPEVFKESWICESSSFDVTDRKAATKVMEKEMFRFTHNRPSTVNYIFYGADHRTCLMEVTYTTGNHPIGLLSSGILKK